MAEKNMNAKISVEFEETANRQQLSSGDNLPTLFGKIKKIISDLSTSAFSGSYNDLSDKLTTATADTDGLISAEDKSKLDAFEITATGGKLHDKDIATTDLIPSYMKGATTSADGAAGIVPAPAKGNANRYLRSDGTWAVPPDNNTWTVMKGATSSAAGTAGIVPAPAAGKQTSFLRGDGTWVVPTNTTYGVATTSANGLMSSTDKSNLDMIVPPAVAFATCATARATNNKVASLANFKLFYGAVVVVNFTDTGTANATSGTLTLNVNNTGAKRMIFYNNGTLSSFTYNHGGYFCNDALRLFIYDGLHWVCVSWSANNIYSAMKGATTSAAGTAGLVPAPAKGANTKFLRGDGTWQAVSATNADTVDNYHIATGTSSSPSGSAGTIYFQYTK